MKEGEDVACRAKQCVFDDGRIVEILAVIGLFGFLNRWNDSMATDLEDPPMWLASRTYGDHWERGKHGPA